MTIQFKRSKKLERALKCMRDSQRDHDTSNLSIGSNCTSMNEDDDDNGDDTTVEIEHTSKAVETNPSFTFRHDQRPAPRDPEERLDAENRLGIRGGGASKGQQNVFQLFKVERGRKEEKGPITTTDDNDNDTADDSTTIDLRKKKNDNQHMDDIEATQTNNDDMYSNDTSEMEPVNFERIHNAGNQKPLDDYQKELFMAIKTFEARRIKRLQQLGFNDESTLSIKRLLQLGVIDDESTITSFDKTVESEFTSQPSEHPLSKEPPAPIAFEDRNDGSTDRAPNPLPPPSQYTPPPVVQKVHQTPTPRETISSRIPAPRPVREQPTMTAGQQTNTFAAQQELHNMMTGLRTNILAPQELQNGMSGQRTNNLSAQEPQNMMTGLRTNNLSAQELQHMMTSLRTNNLSAQELQNMMVVLRTNTLDQNGAVGVQDRQQPNMMVRPQQTRPLDRKHAIIPDREQPNMMVVQRSNALAAREQPNVKTVHRSNPLDPQNAIIPDREQPNNTMIEQQPKIADPKAAAILAHLTEVANHLVKQNKLLESSGNTAEADLNRRMLRENTSELLRNLAILRGHTSVEQPPISGRMIVAKVDKVPNPVETKVTEHPADARPEPQTNIALLRAKRDKAAQNVRKETQRLSNMLESSAIEAHRKKGYYHGTGGRSDEECMLSKIPSNSRRRKKKKPFPEQEVSWEESQFDSQQFDDRVNRLDRVKSMIEELRYLRSSKYSDE